jgi:acyl-homoserine lactone acylase PvdQ
MMKSDNPVHADRYSPDVFGDTPGRTNTRGLRTADVLSGALHFTTEDAIELALDEKWQGTEDWQRILDQALNREAAVVATKSAEFRLFADRLLHFDGFAHADSVEALNYYYWHMAIWSGPEGARLTIKDVEDPLWKRADITTQAGRILVEGIDRAIAALKKDRGTIDAKLGDVFRIGRGGQSWPIGGATIVPESLPHCKSPIDWDRYCVATLRAMTFGPLDKEGHRFPFLGSRVLRLVIFTNPIQSFTLHPFGQSPDPKSPHYNDQTRLASERKLRPEYFNKDELMKHVSSKEEIEVRIPPLH